jgi:hypothetical protein
MGGEPTPEILYVSNVPRKRGNARHKSAYAMEFG